MLLFGTTRVEDGIFKNKKNGLPNEIETQSIRSASRMSVKRTRVVTTITS